MYAYEPKQLEVTLDLETLGLVGSKKQMSTILSIGAVAFDPQVNEDPDEIITPEQGVLYSNGGTIVDVSRPSDGRPMFYTPVSLLQSMQHGFTVDPGTAKWWQDQKYNMIATAAAHQEKLERTFQRLANWLAVVQPRKIWANAPTFDCAMLREAFDHMGMKFDVYFRDERDIRTAREFAEVADVTRKSPDYFVPHHALFDAGWEAWVVSSMYARKRFIKEELADLTRLRQMEFDMIAAAAKSKDRDPTVVDGCATSKG